jgi:hypothetical protein
LNAARHYWLCSVRPDGRPHCVPRWCVYLDGRIYYDGSPETRHARNIMENPHVSLHLESGEQAIILEGTAAPAGKPSAELASSLAAAYRSKYAALGYTPAPTSGMKAAYTSSPRASASPGRSSTRTRPSLCSRANNGYQGRAGQVLPIDDFRHVVCPCQNNKSNVSSL